MRGIARRVVRGLFQLCIGIFLVLITTPSLTEGFPGFGPVGAATLGAAWPFIGLLLYLQHIFEEAGRPHPSLNVSREPSLNVSRESDKKEQRRRSGSVRMGLWMPDLRSGRETL